MKRIIIITLLSLGITGCRSNGKISDTAQAMTPEEVNAQIESLRKFIIPPKGVSKADVDVVFGVPEEIKGPPTKGSAADYPMHEYQLLTPEKGQEFRARLYITYRDDKIALSAINHYCVVKNRAFYPKEEIERENVWILEDLIDIHNKYENKLKDASWNK